MFVFEIQFRIAPGKRREFLQTVGSLQHRSDETGAIRQTVYQELEANERYLWWDRSGSVAELKGRLQSTELRTLLGAIRVLGSIEDMQILDSEPAGVDIEAILSASSDSDESSR